jgi:hypothetical protein
LASLSFENHNINFSKPFFLNKERNELYYVADSFFTLRNLYASHFEIAKKINEINCRIVGFDSFDFNDMQYPLWVLIKKNSHNINTKIFNLNINNKSSVYVNNEFVEKKICAIIYFDKEIRLLLF